MQLPRLVAIALCGALAATGLALGAESQREVFLEPDVSIADQANQAEATGDIVVLTAVLVAGAAAAGALLLSRRGPWARLGLACALAVPVYAGVFLAQGAWPNYTAQLEARLADVTTSVAAANVPTVPSLFLPIFALVAADRKSVV